MWQIIGRLVFMVLVALAAMAPAHAEKRVALVIGIDEYRDVTRLQKAVGDAEAVAAKLSGLGFTVSKVLNPDRRTLNLALAKLYKTIEAGDTVLVHYSGHGVEIDGQNYLLPADIPVPESGEVDLLKSEALALASLVETLGDKGAAVRILIIDACRDNPFAKSGKRSLGASRGLKPVEPPKGTFIMYSAGSGQAALDRLNDADKSPTSVYTRVLLSRLDQPGMPLRDLAASVREEVDELTRSVGHEQRPAYYDDLPADFTFIPATGETAVLAPPVQPAPPPVSDLSEEQAFKLSQSIDTVEGWNAFLSKFPAGAYAPFALAAKDKLITTALPKPKPETTIKPEKAEPAPKTADKKKAAAEKPAGGSSGRSKAAMFAKAQSYCRSKFGGNSSIYGGLQLRDNEFKFKCRLGGGAPHTLPY